MRKLTPENITIKKEDRALNATEINVIQSNLNKIIADKNVSKADKKLARRTAETIINSGANAGVNNNTLTFENSLGQNIDDDLRYKGRTFFGKVNQWVTGNESQNKSVMKGLSNGVNDMLYKQPIMDATNKLRDYASTLDLKPIDVPKVNIPDISSIWDLPIDEIPETIASTKTIAKKSAKKDGTPTTKPKEPIPKGYVVPPMLSAINPPAKGNFEILVPKENKILPEDPQLRTATLLMNRSESSENASKDMIGKIEKQMKDIESSLYIKQKSISDNMLEGMTESNMLNPGLSTDSQNKALFRLKELNQLHKEFSDRALKHSNEKTRLKKAIENITTKYKVDNDSKKITKKLEGSIKKDGGIIKAQQGVLFEGQYMDPQDLLSKILFRNTKVKGPITNYNTPLQSANQALNPKMFNSSLVNQDNPNGLVYSKKTNVPNPVEKPPYQRPTGLNDKSGINVVVNKTPISGIQALSALMPAISAFAMKPKYALQNYAEDYVNKANGIGQDNINAFKNNLGASENQALYNNTSTDFSTRMNVAANLTSNRNKAFNEMYVNDANMFNQNKALEVQGVNANNQARNAFTNNLNLGKAQAENQLQQAKWTGIASTMGAFGKLYADQASQFNLDKSNALKTQQMYGQNHFNNEKERLIEDYTRAKNTLNPLFANKKDNIWYDSAGKPHTNQQMFNDAEKEVNRLGTQLQNHSRNFNEMQLKQYNDDINMDKKPKSFMHWFTGSRGNRAYKKGGLTLSERKELQEHRELIKDNTKDLKRLVLDYIKENNSQNNKVADRNLQKLKLLLLRK